MMPDQSLIIAQTNSVTQGITLMIVGMAIVFCSLCVLLLLIVLINKLWAQKPTVVEAQDITTSASSAHDPQLVAVLTAAAMAAIRRPLSVHRVRLTSSRQRPGMSSHRPRR